MDENMSGVSSEFGVQIPVQSRMGVLTESHFSYNLWNLCNINYQHPRN
jgi:hypothetical protein